ncbi:MAG: Na+/H+ antiporter subunit E [Hyphomonadaceae bacterium]|jgi:multisubunit Na+/H+ antiporter MnhE subunit|nr:Na+/H+ antiporter subunit E [Hyphomonadaceae bacterium]
MLHAAAMLIGLFVLALLVFSQRSLSEAVMLAGAVSVACVLFAARFGGVGATLWSAPQVLVLGLTRTGAVLSGAVRTIRSAIAADVTLKPALVRVRARGERGLARAVIADLVSAAPGAIVVETEADGDLVHVTDEDAIDADDLGALEARVLAALDGGRQP